jgi:hypothetical protein
VLKYPRTAEVCDGLFKQVIATNTFKVTGSEVAVNVGSVVSVAVAVASSVGVAVTDAVEADAVELVELGGPPAGIVPLGLVPAVFVALLHAANERTRAARMIILKYFFTIDIS